MIVSKSATATGKLLTVEPSLIGTEIPAAMKAGALACSASTIPAHYVGEKIPTTRPTSAFRDAMDLHSIPFRDVSFPSAEMDVETRSDGSLVITPVTPLNEYIANLPLVMSQQAKDRPQQPYLKQRDANGDWLAINYEDAFRDSSAVAAWLFEQNIENLRPVLILSANSIHHAVFKYGAMAAQIPACPVSINYSLMGGDYGRLNHVINMLKPAVVFAEHTERYKAALDSVDFGDAIVVTASPDMLERSAVAIADVLKTEISERVSESIAAIDPDAPSVYMLTSGSTSLPKAKTLKSPVKFSFFSVLTNRTAMDYTYLGDMVKMMEAIALEY